MVHGRRALITGALALAAVAASAMTTDADAQRITPRSAAARTPAARRPAPNVDSTATPAAASGPSGAQRLEQAFRTPPAEAKPRVWWH